MRGKDELTVNLNATVVNSRMNAKSSRFSGFWTCTAYVANAILPIKNCDNKHTNHVLATSATSRVADALQWCTKCDPRATAGPRRVVVWPVTYKRKTNDDNREGHLRPSSTNIYTDLHKFVALILLCNVSHLN